MTSNSSWRIDDMDGGLDGGLASELFNLSGLGNEFGAEGAYNMSDVLNLQIFKEEPSSVFQTMDTADLESSSLSDVTVEVTSSAPRSPIPATKKGVVMSKSPQRLPDENTTNCSPQCGIFYILRAPTSPTKRLEEDSLTYLNQGQSYLVELTCLPDEALKFKGQCIKSVVKLCFYERKLQVQESEKYEEWKNNRPADRLLEIDVPMSSGVYNIRSKGNLLNCYEFEWDPTKESKLYVIINCVSSEFTKGKSGGESGVPFSLQVDSFSPSSTTDSNPIHCAGCQIKVFKSKGADRKHKVEMQKLELKSQDELGQLRPSLEYTELKKLPLKKEEDNSLCWMSPRSVAGSMSSPPPAPQVMSTSSNVLSTPAVLSSASPLGANCSELTSQSTVNETRVWLQNNRFQNYTTMFANYTGADLLRLSKQDMVQILGPADGIRLHNSLQARAAHPLLTLYICMDSAQQNSGMKEYYAMYLEALTLVELRKKLALKCSLSVEQIVGIYRQGPTGIYVLIDDEVVRNFVDEGHFIVQLVRGKDTYQVILK
ncbi:PREDICTED: transcription factor CP2-like isoform X2 [Acropora digitifera]|uniref:transcription factor CP2-like isoform X2 n=2 Tax=Acropora digitifera TaxID=70779 RepID=UPI00077A0A0C|nr:PREDICTED: transcription factor CP2-like isoform X2 [Acropora digitifera]